MTLDEAARPAPAWSWRRPAAATPTFIPLLGALAVFVWFAADEAGFETRTWYPGALILVAVLAVCLVAVPPPRPSRRTWTAVALVAGYAAWSFLSITWAAAKGVAWDGANRALLYAVVLALFALWPLGPRAAATLLGGYALAIVGVGLVELLRVNAADDAARFFFEGRLVEPAGYVNANVALWFSAFWPCIVFAGRRGVHPLLRGAFLGGAQVLCGLALLGQSRGWLLALPVMALLAVVLVPGRARTVLALLAVAIGTAATAGPLLDVYDGYTPGQDLGPPVADATRALLIAAAALFVLGAAVGLLERRRHVSESGERRADLVALGAVAISVVAALAVFTAAVGNPVSEASDYWSDFKQGGTTPSAGEARLTGTAATDRYDFWRVGWDMFTDRPLDGFGADNFQQEYFVRGKSEQQPRYPHSLEIRVLAQTGIVGAILLAAGLLAAAAAAAPALRRAPGLGPPAAAAALLVTAYWLVHGSLDWFWEFPGLGAPAFAALGIACALGDGTAGPRGEGASRRARVAAFAAAGALVVVALLSLVGPWLSDLYVRRAGDTWQERPAQAFDDLDRAADLNPLSPVPALTAGTIAVKQGRLDVAERHFKAALDREPSDAYARLQLGAIASERGRRREALRWLTGAAVLTPNYDVLRNALQTVRRGRRVTAAEINRRIVEATRARIGLQ